jgi:hypothetical protein
MGSLPQAMQAYHRQLQEGVIQQAYRGLMDYMQSLKAHFKNKFPTYIVSGSLYFGYMDMTYFAFTPPALKERGLKIAIVFVHETFTFEVWLSGYNRAAQAKFWSLFKDSAWDKYGLQPSPRNPDAILAHTLVNAPDFTDLDALTDQIERGTLAFIANVDAFLAAAKV